MYITQRKNMVAHHISTCPIMDLFEEAERWPGLWVSKRPW